MKYVESEGEGRPDDGNTVVSGADAPPRGVRILGHHAPGMRPMMDTLVVVITTGLALGYVIGYRAGKVIFFKVGGPFARKPLIVSFVAAGSFLFLVPATLFAILGARNLPLAPDGLDSSGSPVVLAGIALGIALIIGSGLVVAVLASTVCGRFIEEVRLGRP